MSAPTPAGDAWQNMRALIARAEQATGADRELDGLIAAADGWERVHGSPIQIDLVMGKDPGNHEWADVPAYTASLDAAASLAPSGWRWWVNSEAYGRCWLVADSRVADTAQSEKCHTPALALTAAALRARLAMMEDTRDE